MKTINFSDDEYTMLKAIIISEQIDGNSWIAKELKNLKKLLVYSEMMNHIRTSCNLTDKILGDEE